MPLPASWVDHIFAKLSVRYGAGFARQWGDADPLAVKADWAEVLDGFERHKDALQYAIDNLPDALPLNALQFRAIARRSPAPEVPRLPEPKADPGLVNAALKAMNATKGEVQSKSMAQQCIDNIESIVRNRAGKISSAQKHMVSHCLRMDGTSTTLSVKAAE